MFDLVVMTYVLLGWKMNGNRPVPHYVRVQSKSRNGKNPCASDVPGTTPPSFSHRSSAGAFNAARSRLLAAFVCNSSLACFQSVFATVCALRPQLTATSTARCRSIPRVTALSVEAVRFAASFFRGGKSTMMTLYWKPCGCYGVFALCPWWPELVGLQQSIVPKPYWLCCRICVE